MKINNLVIYMLLLGWAGVIFALGMPFLLSVVPDLSYESTFYHNLWMAGGGVSILAGSYILWENRNAYAQIAGVFLVIGIGSLGYALLYPFI